MIKPLVRADNQWSHPGVCTPFSDPGTPAFGDVSPRNLCLGWHLAWLLNPGLRVAKDLDFKIRLVSRALSLEGVEPVGQGVEHYGAFAQDS